MPHCPNGSLQVLSCQSYNSGLFRVPSLLFAELFLLAFLAKLFVLLQFYNSLAKCKQVSSGIVAQYQLCLLLLRDWKFGSNFLGLAVYSLLTVRADTERTCSQSSKVERRAALTSLPPAAV